MFVVNMIYMLFYLQNGWLISLIKNENILQNIGWISLDLKVTLKGRLVNQSSSNLKKNMEMELTVNKVSNEENFIGHDPNDVSVNLPSCSKENYWKLIKRVNMLKIRCLLKVFAAKFKISYALTELWSWMKMFQLKTPYQFFSFFLRRINT